MDKMEDCLYFFSKSADCPPGLGVNEHVTNPDQYRDLAAIKDWRKMLSNFWVAKFTVQGVEWNTVEHMFQAYKLSLENKNIARSMCLNSGTELSKSSGEAARAMRKAVILNKEQLEKWDSTKDRVLEAALYAKFSQNAELKNVLLLTGSAQLWHGIPRTPKQRQYILEKVRDQISR